MRLPTIIAPLPALALLGARSKDATPEWMRAFARSWPIQVDISLDEVLEELNYGRG
ncbi:MAG: hypothetical protein WBB42_01265 [Polyangiales bacterium]